MKMMKKLCCLLLAFALLLSFGCKKMTPLKPPMCRMPPWNPRLSSPQSLLPSSPRKRSLSASSIHGLRLPPIK